MPAIRALVIYIFSVDALLYFDGQLDWRERPRVETAAFARFLLALPVAGRRCTNHKQSWAAFSGRRSNRRSDLIASTWNDASKLGHSPVRWMSIYDSRSPSKGATIRTMPLLPRNSSYIPYSQAHLNIMEPRYRAMYDDIIYSGARSFAVCLTRHGQVMETANVFYLEDIQEVSEKTEDKIKYIGTHRLIDRVKVLKVLNPHAAETKETYLLAEVEYVVDADVHLDTSAAESDVKRLFEDFVLAQERIQEDIRFSTDLVRTLQFNRQTDGAYAGLWGVVALWQEFLKRRVDDATKRSVKHLMEVTKTLANQANSGNTTKRSVVDQLLVESEAIARNSIEELWTSKSDPSSDEMLAIIQSTSHYERLMIFKGILGEHYHRLKAMECLKAVLN